MGNTVVISLHVSGTLLVQIFNKIIQYTLVVNTEKCIPYPIAYGKRLIATLLQSSQKRWINSAHGILIGCFARGMPRACFYWTQRVEDTRDLLPDGLGYT
jgi:hypothetical protein